MKEAWIGRENHRMIETGTRRFHLVKGHSKSKKKTKNNEHSDPKNK
jgi:hypothetical protein